MKLAEAIDWAQAIKPEICIPVHDDMLQPREWIYNLPTSLFPGMGIKFDAVELGKPHTYV